MGLNALRRPPPRAVVAVGMFDGVHVGHQRVIRTAIRLAKRLSGTSVVMTFHPDPQQVLDPRHAQPRLTPLAMRLRFLQALGVDGIWVIPFTRAFSTLSAGEFVRAILVKRLQASCVVVGETFSFGRARRGNLGLLRTLGRRHGMRVVVVPALRRGGAPVSSSRIRRLIQQGHLTEARGLLGRAVELYGTVVRGDRRARRLGFPTANVRLANQLLPPRGVYQVRLSLADSFARCFPGVMNLGFRPTFLPAPPPKSLVGGPARRAAHPRGRAAMVCEVHLVGFRGNLYGRPVAVALVKRLRAEHRFRSPGELVKQIRRDVRRARLLTSP